MLFMLLDTEPVALRTEARNDSNRESAIGLSQLSASLPVGAMRNVVSFIAFGVVVSQVSSNRSRRVVVIRWSEFYETELILYCSSMYADPVCNVGYPNLWRAFCDWRTKVSDAAKEHPRLFSRSKNPSLGRISQNLNWSAKNILPLTINY